MKDNPPAQSSELDEILDKRILVKTDEGEPVWGKIVPIDVFHINKAIEAYLNQKIVEELENIKSAYQHATDVEQDLYTDYLDSRIEYCKRKTSK